LYFDSVDTGFYRLDPFAVPRIAFYTAAGLKLLIDADTWEDDGAKRYGLMPVRSDSVFCFIQHNGTYGEMDIGVKNARCV
jgi:hypothetical protein